jgi:hypothetical protein
MPQYYYRWLLYNTESLPRDNKNEADTMSDTHKWLHFSQKSRPCRDVNCCERGSLDCAIAVLDGGILLGFPHAAGQPARWRWCSIINLGVSEYELIMSHCLHGGGVID